MTSFTGGSARRPATCSGALTAGPRAAARLPGRRQGPPLALLLTAALAAGATCASAAAPPVKISSAWCRATTTGASTAACYLTLAAPRDDRLVAFETPAAAHGEIHTMSLDGGVMRMRQLPDGLILPAGKAIALKPGGEHLMLIGLKAPLKVGRVVALTLQFSRSGPLVVSAPVRLSAPQQGAR